MLWACWAAQMVHIITQPSCATTRPHLKAELDNRPGFRLTATRPLHSLPGKLDPAPLRDSCHTQLAQRLPDRPRKVVNAQDQGAAPLDCHRPSGASAAIAVRKRSYGDYAERYYRFGQHLGGRDQKAVRKTVSGLIKLLHPDGEVSKDEVEEYLAYAMEMRRRVKEQLKKMGGLEYWDTTFSYIDQDGGKETFIRVPEMGGGTIIAEGGLPPGGIYTIGSDAADRRLAMFLLQTQMNRGSGRIITLGNLSSKMKEAVKAAEAYLKANLKNLGIDYDLKAYNFTVQAINLNQAREGSETAVAFFLSMVSAVLGKPVLDRTVVLGEMSVQGMLIKVASLPERMQAAVEAGAKRILIPSENKRRKRDIHSCSRDGRWHHNRRGRSAAGRHLHYRL